MAGCAGGSVRVKRRAAVTPLPATVKRIAVVDAPNRPWDEDRVDPTFGIVSRHRASEKEFVSRMNAYSRAHGAALEWLDYTSDTVETKDGKNWEDSPSRWPQSDTEQLLVAARSKADAVLALNRFTFRMFTYGLSPVSEVNGQPVYNAVKVLVEGDIRDAKTSAILTPLAIQGDAGYGGYKAKTPEAETEWWEAIGRELLQELTGLPPK